MWLIIVVIAFALLSCEVAVTSIIILIMLNGFPRLPDGFIAIYALFTMVMVTGLSFLSGFLAWKLSEKGHISLPISGVITILISIIIAPVSLFVLTFVLLYAYGMI